MESNNKELITEVQELPLIREIKKLFPQESKEVDELISSLVTGLTNPSSLDSITTNHSREDNKI